MINSDCQNENLAEEMFEVGNEEGRLVDVQICFNPRFDPQTSSNILITSFIYSPKTYISCFQSDFKNPPDLFVKSNINYSTLSGGC